MIVQAPNIAWLVCICLAYIRITLYIMYYTVLWCIVNLWILCLILSTCRWKYSINSSPCAWVSMMLRSMTVKCTSCHLRSTRNRRINRLSFNDNMFFYPEIRDENSRLGQRRLTQDARIKECHSSRIYLICIFALVFWIYIFICHQLREFTGCDWFFWLSAVTRL